MIKEAYVSFEVAKLLKDKGFQQIQDNCGYFTTDMVYSIAADKEGEHHFAKQYPAGVYNKDKYIAAPTQQMATRWLREIYNIDISITPDRKNGYSVLVFINKTLPFKDIGSFSSYENSVENAIKYCLKHLI